MLTVTATRLQVRVKTEASFSRKYLRVGLVSYNTMTKVCLKHLELACEQAPGGASAEQTFGAKRRAISSHCPDINVLTQEIRYTLYGIHSFG